MIEPTRSTFNPKKILVPMDFSPSSISALTTTIELARLFHAELYLLHVIPMLPIVTGIEFPTSFYPNQEFLADAEKESEKKMAEFVSNLLGQGIKASSKVEIGNDVVGNVLMVIEREHVDMLVISTHGMSGWRPVVFGSIAEKVVKLAECPVLLLRSAKILDKDDPKGAK
ncbi:universal stress protein [Granulicella mallensis]|uniref:UspA domain-containing protein n=1 Tax=Granulicella mallensis (strain ATCC BAA-1857 / DSM 23137 / MP5ACTX8) TaxID=682795 RepID=G8NP09_GRAMM|nr:universal stress protein [Granulicella mallensis]AEU37113.1 UspA domain-containing protein [Granulicella mallensis MP5ACTX8]